MARKGDQKGNGTPRITIIRREDSSDAGHHGGAWKVAYADFVTALMAFFLLMWLLNATTDKQRRGIAEYFSPADVLGHSSTGSGQPFGGHTPFDDGGLVSDKGTMEVINGPRPPVTDADDDDSTTPAMPRPHRKDTPTTEPDAHKEQSAPSVSGDTPASATPAAARTPPAARLGAGSNVLAPNALGPSQTPQAKAGTAAGSGAAQGTEDKPASEPPRPPTAAEIRAEAARREKQAFDQAAQAIRDAVRSDPQLADLGRQLAIDMTPEGLRIQIMDEDHQPMFASGSATPNERTRLLLQKIAPVLMRLPEDLSIAGHTDAAPFPGPGRSNWELSTDRANATRRMLVEAGLPESRVRSVIGNADRDPLLPADPMAAANRRIAIVVIRNVPPAAAAASPGGGAATGTGPVPLMAPAAPEPSAEPPAPAAPPSIQRLIGAPPAPPAGPAPSAGQGPQGQR